MMAEFIGALIASVYGCVTVFRKKTPLFYKIIFFSMLVCFMGNVYTLLYHHLWQMGDTGFHMGYLGYIGMFFFLYSSYYGAFDSIADGKEPEFRRFRMIAGVVAILFFAGSIFFLGVGGKDFWKCLILIPMSFTMYFATKHLIIPDVEMGIIRVMRPYSALIIGLCICMLPNILSIAGWLQTIGDICAGILLALCMPIARNGVRKWFI